MIAILAFILIIGLVVGSFLNVVILRTVSGESIVFPGSKCPKCQNPLKWYHNIPVLSYLFLKGKCAFCKEKINIQYPIVELLTGIIFTAFGYLYLNSILYKGGSVQILTIMLLISLIASSLFIVISGTDFKEMQVSDVHTYSLIGLGIVYSIIVGGFAFYAEFKFGITRWALLYTPIFYTIFAIGVSFMCMEILRRGANFLMKTETIGDGDSYIFCGIAGVITSLFGANDIRYLLIVLLIIFFTSIFISVIFTLPIYLRTLFADKNWRLIIMLSTFIIYCCGYFYAENSGLLGNFIILIICTLILLILGILLCFEVLKGIKNNTHEGTQIPFGPALCASGLIALFVIPILLAIV